MSIRSSKALHRVPQLPDFSLATPARRRPRLIVIWDVLVSILAMTLIAVIHGITWIQVVHNLPWALGLVLVGPGAVYLLGGYDTATKPLGSGPLDWMMLMLTAGTTLWVVMLLMEWQVVDADAATLAVAWVFLGCGWYAGRLLSRLRLARHPQNTLVVGTGISAMRVVEIAHRFPEHGLRVVGLVDDHPLDLPVDAPPVVGSLAELPYLMNNADIRRVIVAYSDGHDGELVEVLRRANHQGRVRVQVVPRMWELVDHDATIDALGPLALVEVTPGRPNRIRSTAKRLFDILFSGGCLILASPIMLAAAIAIRVESPGALIFNQTRVGRGGREFRIKKFRSMYADADRRTDLAAEIAAADAEGAAVVDIETAVAQLKQEDDPRITRVGRFIRRTSIDELPQLWNVLRGDMSIVGPRPLRPFEAQSLNDWQRHRHDVRPGITGSWQVLGRSDVTWDERMQMDYAYARNHSLRQDLRILARTANVVIGAKGAR